MTLSLHFAQSLGHPSPNGRETVALCLIRRYASASGLLGPPIKASNADLKKVPNNGSIDAYAAGRTQLILDISGLFAP